MFKKISVFFLLTVICCFITPNNYLRCNFVNITKQSTYYEVNINSYGIIPHFEIGRQYGISIQKVNPNFEEATDRYLLEAFNLYGLTIDVLMQRVNDLKKNIPWEYRDEIDGMASTFHGKTDFLGDGKLSSNELYLYNLLIEVIDAAACSGVSVFGERSATGSTIIGRNYDWYPGNSLNDLSNAITIIHNGKRAVCFIGWLGFIGAHTGFNDKGIYAAYTWSATGAPYETVNRYSVVMSIRYALENMPTYYSVVSYLKDDWRKYTFNNDIIIANSQKCEILENDFSSPNNLPTIRRALRNSTSTLRAGVLWDEKSAICVVNSFVLDGNDDNHSTQLINTYRWENFRALLSQRPGQLTIDDIQSMMSYVDPYYIIGDIYKMRPMHEFGDYDPTMQSIIFDTKNNVLHCYFQQTSIPEVTPHYETIKIVF